MVPELGAGGGGGDLHQTSELDLCNISSISEIEEVSKQILKDPNDVKRLISKIDSARSSRDLKMSLEGLVLDTEEEISLQEFMERLLASDGVIPSTRSERVPEKGCAGGDPVNDTMHFPFSRHSSYSELCCLVETFKPRDIYPCTVDEQTWTEAVSMRSLFGHLSSGTIFRHDGEMRSLLHERLKSEEPSRKRLKRNPIDDTQEIGSPESTSQEYCTAPRPNIHIQRQGTIPTSSKPANIKVIHEEEALNRSKPLSPHLAAIKAAFESYIGRGDLDHSTSSSSDDDVEEYEPASLPTVNHVSGSQVSISQSAFDHESQECCPHAGLQVDGAEDEGPSRAAEVPVLHAPDGPSDHRSRRAFRKQAYRAAKLTLHTSNSGVWDDLGIRSVGNNGHCEPEEEL